jgi:hypothetical protein
MAIKLSVPVLFCLFLGTACHTSTPTGPSVPLSRPFILLPGEAATVDGSPLRVHFVGVVSDSRCPADAFCIQAGDAVVQITAQGDRLAQYELHTGDQSRTSVVHEGWRIALVTLEPYPFSTRPIQGNEYRGTFTVTK